MKDRPSRRGSQQAPPAPALPYSGGEADAFMRDLLLRISEEARKSRPTMARVISAADGGLTVQIDGEKAPRTIALPRALGEAYKANDRVKLSLLRNDEYVVDGIYSDGATDRRVERNQLGFNAVGFNELADFAVGFDHLDDPLWTRVMNALTSIPNNSIGPQHIVSNAVGKDELGAGAVDYQHLHSSGRGSFGTDVINLINFAKGKGWI